MSGIIYKQARHNTRRYSIKKLFLKCDCTLNVIKQLCLKTQDTLFCKRKIVDIFFLQKSPNDKRIPYHNFYLLQLQITNKQISLTRFRNNINFMSHFNIKIKLTIRDLMKTGRYAKTTLRNNAIFNFYICTSTVIYLLQRMLNKIKMAFPCLIHVDNNFSCV